MPFDYWQVAIVFVAIVMDFVTGIAKAIKQHNFTSEAMREGLYHKSAEMIAIAMGYYVQFALPHIGVTVAFPVASFILVYTVIMEIGSIIENLGIINPDLVGPLSTVFEKIKGGNDNGKTYHDGN